MNWSEKQTEFWAQGYTVFDDFFDKSLIKDWRERALSIAERISFFTDHFPNYGIKKIKKTFLEADLEARDAAGTYDLITINYIAIKDRFPHLECYYNSLTPFLSLFTGLDIVISQDEESAATIMIYEPPAGQMVSHFDSQDISVLLYFTDNSDGGTELWPITSRRPTILGQPDEIIGEPVTILPQAGRMVLFQGQKCWHKACAVEKATKVSSAWNYYIRGNSWRPAQINERLYK